MTTETLTFGDVVKQLDAMYEKVTPDPTFSGYWIPKPEDADIVDSFRRALARGVTDKVYIVNSGPEDDPVIIALTGNGPRAEANAAFLSHLLNNWPAISAEVHELKRQLSLAAIAFPDFEETMAEHQTLATPKAPDAQSKEARGTE